MDLGHVIQRVRAGDSAAFGELVRATTPTLFRLAARMMANAADAQDVLQDAYVDAHSALVQGRFDQHSKAETWLYRIVINRALDSLRSRKRHHHEALDTMMDTGQKPSTNAESAALAHLALRELDEWLRELPVDQRAALILKELEGMTSAEIAVILGTTEGAVEQRVVRARNTLRKRSHSDD